MQPFKENIEHLENASYYAFEVPGSYEPYWHFHPEIELTYVPHGSGTRCVGDHVGHYKNGDLVLLGRNVPHQWVCQRDGTEEEQRSLVLHFRSEIFEHFPECRMFDGFFEQAKRGILFPMPSQLIIHTIESLLDYKGLQSMLQLIELVDLLRNVSNQVTLASSHYVNAGTFGGTGVRLEKAYTFVNQNYTRSITQEEIAAHCNLTSSSFSRWFKKNAGTTFVDYVRKMRVSHAEQLLYMTKRPINEIAHQSGFESSSAFNRSFKQVKGVSPREFRGK